MSFKCGRRRCHLEPYRLGLNNAFLDHQYTVQLAWKYVESGLIAVLMERIFLGVFRIIQLRSFNLCVPL